NLLRQTAVPERFKKKELDIIDPVCQVSDIFLYTGGYDKRSGANSPGVSTFNPLHVRHCPPR
ncbi:MAG: hypothetical protein MUO63_12220, partial [Desulfobulbaceae bacterium]|nr:hypothetical protein [Desulfobulbaceae bacterium]